MSNYLKNRHIGLSEEDKKVMLQAVGAAGIEQLLKEVFPDDIRLRKPLDLPEALSERDQLDYMAELAAANQPLKTYIGRGWYDTLTPSVIVRNVLENPVWYTSYTPYQAEISQGRLEALFVFQTMISDLTGLPLSNCSLLDEATSAAEAVTMMRNLRSREQVKAGACKVLVDEKIVPNTRSVIETRALGQGIELVFGNYASFEFTPESRPGAKTPPQLNKLCHGVDLHNMDAEAAIAQGINLEYVIDAYRDLTAQGKQFYLKNNFFDLLMGRTEIREMIAQGKSAAEIKATWADDVVHFKQQRAPYLIYPEK